MSFQNDNEMKYWTYDLGEKVYVWDYDNDTFETHNGEPLLGTVTSVNDPYFSITPIGETYNILYRVERVWKVGTGPTMNKTYDEVE